ncbi:MAG: hypothetical protein Q7R60_03090 [bacterium]|nr:hypothetical protein [bacterium]
MDPTAAKQQIAERIKQANNILVTVSNNPSVDQLAACIGLTLLLNKMDKHATAVFSGQVPSTIEFLQPEKTIETNTDSLQDFIISLDKDKADKLRYKVEDQVVRIFITPYKTSISEKDLIFSQGDFNVEVVMALGVKDRSQLDAAITAHGRILHDATVVSVNAGKDKAAELGQINWQDPTASSLSEMLVSISEAFGAGLIDNQMATAFLTGIVAETARFSNAKTSPKVMTMSAQLMAAGANQQLIVSKLEPPMPPAASGGRAVPKVPSPPKGPQTGVLNVSHKPDKTSSEEVEVKAGEIRIDEKGNIISSQNEIPLAPRSPQAPIIRTAQMPLAQSPLPAMPAQKQEGNIPGPHTLLDPTGHQPAINPPFTADTDPQWNNKEGSIATDPLGDMPKTDNLLIGRGKSIEPAHGEVLQPLATPQPPVLAVNTARSAVDNAYAGAPFDPADHPVISLNAQALSQPLHQTPGNLPPPVPPPLMPAPGTINKKQ